MSDLEELLEIAETVDAMLDEAASSQARAVLDEGTWRVLAEAGLRRVALPESAGGSDGELAHLAVVLRRLGYHAASVPLLEDHLAAEVLAGQGIDVPLDVVTLSSRSDLVAHVGGSGATVTGSLRVPWGRVASLVLAPAQTDSGVVLVALPVEAGELTPRVNVAGEPRDILRYQDVAPVAEITSSEAVAGLRSGVLVYRSLAMLGAGERALDLTISHVTNRTQFGRPLAHRQVVQQYIAEMFGALTATRAASDAAVVALADRSGSRTLAAALATRVEADRMASLVGRLSHQLHGAIGFTQEHPLYLSTTRLTAWRQDDLSEAACARELSQLVPGLGGPWETLTGRARA